MIVGEKPVNRKRPAFICYLFSFKTSQYILCTLDIWRPDGGSALSCHNVAVGQLNLYAFIHVYYICSIYYIELLCLSLNRETSLKGNTFLICSYVLSPNKGFSILLILLLNKTSMVRDNDFHDRMGTPTQRVAPKLSHQDISITLPLPACLLPIVHPGAMCFLGNLHA